MIKKEYSTRRRVAGYLAGGFLFIVLTFAGAEIAVRLWVSYLHRAYARGEVIKKQDYAFLWMPITVSMNSHFWNTFREDRTDPRIPPYVLKPFFDIATKAPKSLNAIYRLPSGTYPLTDFTRRPPPAFTANINSQGFRGAEPPKDVSRRWRVLCWGSYQTFGHGVSDEEAYPAVLEAQLGNRYAVWNGGMQSVSLRNIQRRMKFDLDEISPQIVVLETGFVDVLAMNREVLLNPGGAIFSVGSRAWMATQKFFSHFYAGVFGKSYLLSMYSQKTVSGGHDLNLKNWQKRMKVVLDENSRLGIFTIVTNPISGGFPAAAYEAAVAARSDAIFVDIQALFKAIPTEQDREFMARFAAAPNWVTEFPPHLQRLLFHSPFAAYKTNFSHPNRLGHELIAAELNRVIRERTNTRAKSGSDRMPSSRRP